MPFVSLKIPILVQNVMVEEKEHYYLRPLFLNHPVATHRRFESALSQFQQEVKHYFKGFIFNRDNADHFLWYQFNPEVSYKHHEFQFNIGKQYVKGNFGVASFELRDQLFIFFPSVDNFMFIAEKQENGKVDLKAQAKEKAQKLLKEIKSNSGQSFTPEIYFSNPKSFLSEVKVNVNVGLGAFKFENDIDNWFFSRLNPSNDFDGAVEIEKVGNDLNSRYPADLSRAYYQDSLVDQLYQIIFQKDHAPIALVGPEGVGKHTILHEAVWRYQSNFYGAKVVKGQRIWHVDPTRIIAGMSIVGAWQKRFEAILKYLQNPRDSKSSDILLIDNPVAMLRIGRSAQNNMTLSDVLKPYLEKRQLQVIFLASPEEWKIIQEKDRRFSDLFQVLRMQEPDVETATKIVLQKRRVLEAENETRITIQAINQILTLQRNYFNNKPLPGSVMNLLQQLAVKYRYQSVDVPEVKSEFRVFSGLEERIFDPVLQIDKDEVDQIIGRELVGQPKAVETLTNVIHLIKAKLANPSKPISSFLFIGPTGVGKTQAAKVLCNYLMGSEDRLMRFDMNEYIDGSAVQRLIGDYYNPEGQLTGKVRYNPFGVILLDEIEKAHPKVHDLLLQVLDDGRLTDSLGRTVDFSNTIIIMTSNVGAKEASVQLGFNTENRDESAIFQRAVENHFRPEFINRIDQIVIFNPLELDHILSIASLQIKELLKRDGFVRRTTILNISKDALEWVARRGFDAKMGGRALKRQIERDLTTLSAEQLIATKNDSPIIFDILFKEDRLVPNIISLDFVSPLEDQWLPELPDEARGRGFYKKLILNLEKIEKDLNWMEQNNQVEEQVMVFGDKSQGDLNWQYYQFKNRVVDIKDIIKTYMLGFRDRFFIEAPAIPLRLKTSTLYPRKNWSTKGVRENLKDRLFQEEALKELTESYIYAQTQFDSFKTEFIDHYLNVSLLKLFAKDVQEQKTEQLEIKFQSCITGLGNWEISFLSERYVEFFEELDITYKVSKKNKSISVEGYALSKLLAGEAGIHLFYVAHQNPLPIKVVLKNSKGVLSKENNYRVIRIYDGNRTLTDIRTGFTNEMNIMPRELKLLVYAGINPEIRSRLLNF